MIYPKVNTLFKRDQNNIIIPDCYSKEEFKYLENVPFECTEKIDGMNIRVEITNDPEEGLTIKFRGRTDAANIPPNLLAVLKDIFTVQNVMDSIVIDPYKTMEATVYGEGYGNGIQKVGSKYLKNDNSFILFDVLIDGNWLSRESCECIANKLGCDIVPIIDYLTIKEACSYAKAGFNSLIAQDDTLKAEGLVLKTPCGLKFKDGSRVILKIKTCDFNKLDAMLKIDPNYKQIVNSKYETMDTESIC